MYGGVNVHFCPSGTIYSIYRLVLTIGPQDKYISRFWGSSKVHINTNSLSFDYSLDLDKCKEKLGKVIFYS